MYLKNTYISAFHTVPGTRSNRAYLAMRRREDFYESVKNVFSGVCFGVLFLSCFAVMYL